MGSVMPTTNETTALIARLTNLSSKLSTGEDHDARIEALKLSKALTARLELPENVAVDLAFSVTPPAVLVKRHIAYSFEAYDCCERENCCGFEPFSVYSDGGASNLCRIGYTVRWGGAINRYANQDIGTNKLIATLSPCPATSICSKFR
jgi:hypothetical protein